MYRQLYQMGGIGTLPMDFGQPLQVSQPISNPMLNYGETPLTMAGGGIANLVDREKYGLGSKIKKFVRNIIPNEVAQVASVAAPFVAPFNPLLAAGMSALGNFDKTGKIGSSLLRGGLTYAGGQAARYLGGAGFQEGFNPFAGYNPKSGFMGLESLFTSPIGLQSSLGQYFSSPDVLKGTSLELKSPLDLSNIAGDTFKGTSLGMDVAKTVKSTSPGVFEQLKTIFDPTSGVDLVTRAQTAINLTGDAIKAMYTNKDGTIDKRMVISTLSAIPSYLDAKKKADQIGLNSNEFNEKIYEQEKEFFRQRYAAATPDSAYELTTPTGRLAKAAEGGLMDDTGGILSIKLTPAMAMGGRIDYETGGPTTTTPPKTLPMDLESLARRLFQTNLDNLTPLEKQYLYEFKEQNKTKKAKGGRIKYGTGSKDKDNKKPIPVIPEEYEYSFDDEKSFQDFLKQISKRRIEEKANGGRIGFSNAGPASPRVILEKKGYSDMMKGMSDKEILELYDSVMGTFTLSRSKEANGGIMGYFMGGKIPLRQNEGGITELDLRAKGGYIPVGIKEKADDVPAMLSRNEFVFTADAVRGAGGGNINKGAQKMYKLMKSLEKKVKKIKVA
jgi:hypothetical protein